MYTVLLLTQIMSSNGPAVTFVAFCRHYFPSSGIYCNCHVCCETLCIIRARTCLASMIAPHLMSSGATLAMHCATIMAKCLAQFQKYFPTICNNMTAGYQWATHVNLTVTNCQIQSLEKLCPIVVLKPWKCQLCSMSWSEETCSWSKCYTITG